MTVAIPLWKPRRGIQSGAYLCSGALLLSASLALFLPAAASASSLPPAIINVSPPPGTTFLPNVPSISATATGTSVFDTLTYYVEFATPAGTEHNAINVGVQSSVVLSGVSAFPASNFEAQVLITGSSPGGLTPLDLDVACAPACTQSWNAPIPFYENQQYSVFMKVELSPGAGVTASGSADPIFTPPLFDIDGNAITVETSDGIGNNSPVGTTPIPAALPLFATGLGGLGLLGWRRKRKAQRVA
jgi:hypothetical protein